LTMKENQKPSGLNSNLSGTYCYRKTGEKMSAEKLRNVALDAAEDMEFMQAELKRLREYTTWIDCEVLLPTIDGPAVWVWCDELEKPLGMARYTTELGDVHKDDLCGSGPVWELFCPADDKPALTHVVLPSQLVNKWMPIAVPKKLA